MFCVYKHTAPNDKVYIGITSKNPIYRWNSGKGYMTNKHFYNAILKYGWDNIKHEILFTDLNKEEACQKEIELIAEYKSNDPKFGYNISSGGEVSSAGVKRSNGTRQRMSVSHVGKVLNTGRSVINLSTGELFPSVYSAAKYYDISVSTLTQAIKQWPKTVKGYTFAYFINTYEETLLNLISKE